MKVFVVVCIYDSACYLAAAATFEDETMRVEFKATKQSSPEVTHSKHDLKSPQAEGIRDVDNGNNKEGDHMTEGEETASEDRQPPSSPAGSRKKKRRLSGDKTPKVIFWRSQPS